MPISSRNGEAEQLPPGLKHANDIITHDEELELIRLIEACGPKRYPGDEQGGLSAISFGWNYDLATGEFSLCDPIPEAFTAVRQLAARFAGFAPDNFAQCLFNRYEKGAEIPWHIDKPVWEHVIGISLGSPATMHFRKPLTNGFEHAVIALPPRSIYFLSDEVRHDFAHSIPPVAERRWSITFRTLSAEGEKRRAVLEETGKSKQ